MTDTNAVTTGHPTEAELSDYLSRLVTGEAKKRIEDHIACCPECLAAAVSAYEAVEICGRHNKKEKGHFMKKFNIYLALAIISFILSFAIPRYFMQFLVATLLLGIKWISDAKSTKMLVMIYEAWKEGGEKEASRILGILNPKFKDRF